MISSNLRTPLYAVMAWLTLSTLWNVVGVVLVANGQRAPGPTASLAAAALLVGIGALLAVGVLRSPTLFGALCGICGLFALAAVVQAVTGDPALWPAAFWRWAGAALNAFGAAAGCLGVISTWFRS